VKFLFIFLYRGRIPVVQTIKKNGEHTQRLWQKNFRGRSTIESHQEREIAPISPLHYISGGQGVHWVCTQSSTQENAASRALRNSADLFWKNTHFLENAYPFGKFQGIFMQK